MNFTPRFCAATALVGLIFLAASPQIASAALDPGTPLDGFSPLQQGAITVAFTAAFTGGGPYNEFPYVGADRAAPGDIVLLTTISGDTATDENPSNWAAVARFFSPSDPDGSQGTDATQEMGFLPASTLATPTDFSTFKLFPNVVYIPASTVTPDGVDGTFSEFGPAGAITAEQSAIFLVDVTVPVPEPTSVGLLSLGSVLLLARRRHGRGILVANPME